MRPSFAGAIAVCAALLLNTSLFAAAFTNGNLAVYAATSPSSTPSNNATVSILEIADGGTNPVQTFSISSQTDPLYTTANGTSNGYLSRSRDGTRLLFTGHTNNNGGTGNLNTVLPRGVGAIDFSGNYSRPATYSGTSGQQARSAITLDGIRYLFSEGGGLYRPDASTPALSGSYRKLLDSNSVLYVGQASSTAPMVSVVSTFTDSSLSLTPITGLSANAAFQDFTIQPIVGNQSLLYTLTTSSGVGTLSKWKIVGTTATSLGSANTGTGVGGFGITAQTSSTSTNGFDIYITTGTGASAGNKIVRFTDDSRAFDPLNLSAATDVYTAASNVVLKGVEFAPYTPAANARIDSAPAFSVIGSVTVPGSSGSYVIQNVAITGGATYGSVSISGALASDMFDYRIYLDRVNDSAPFPKILGLTFVSGTFSNLVSGVTYDAYVDLPANGFGPPDYFNFAGMPALQNIGFVPEPSAAFTLLAPAGLLMSRRRRHA